jgi:signal transduction histidine kinase
MTTPDARAHVAQAIENAKAELDEALSELDRVPAFDSAAIGFVAHAMNNYLAVTEATLNLVKNALRDHPDREVVTWLEGLGHVAQLMHHTVGRLLRVSAPAEFALKPDHVNLPLLMRRACDYYGRSAARKQLQIVCRSVGNVPLAWADRVAVAVVADNLLSNAVKFSNVGGEIQVQIMAGPGGVVCSVRDRGPGLSAIDQTRLFQRGVTLGAAPTAGEPSTGFGLAVAKDFVDRMGGKLWCESEPGQGACFSFRLPYHPEGPIGRPPDESS